MSMNSFPGNVCLPRTAFWLLLAVALSVAYSTPAGATTFKLTYEGVFNDQDFLDPAGQPANNRLTNTPFTATAIFSDTSQNLAPSIFPGFVAYSPIMATIAFGGQTYKVASYDEDSSKGITVAVFDKNNPFLPDHYAIGYLQNPVQDGAGFIGDFLGASPEFTVDTLKSTEFTGYYGVGYASGICILGNPANCQQNEITPLRLFDSNNTEWALTLGNYDEDYPVIHDPNSTNILGPLNSAQLQVIPEPGALYLVGTGLVVLLGFARRQCL